MRTLRVDGFLFSWSPSGWLCGTCAAVDPSPEAHAAWHRGMRP